MRFLILALMLLSTSAHAQEAGRDSRRYAISSSQLGVVMLDTMTGETWKFGWSTVPTDTCRKANPTPSECQNWGWWPLPYFSGTPGKPR